MAFFRFLHSHPHGMVLQGSHSIETPAAFARNGGKLETPQKPPPFPAPLGFLLPVLRPED